MHLFRQTNRNSSDDATEPVSESESPAGFDPTLLQILELVLNTEPLQAAVIALNDELATRFACERVVLGLLRGNRVRVRAV